MNWLITSDTHLSDRPKDEYRFGLFQWLAKQQEKYAVEATFLLGDITENKDRHSARLVNRVVDELTLLKPPVFILRGNHDGTSPDNPFFRFVNCIEGIRLIVEPEAVMPGLFMIPHQATQNEFDAACANIRPRDRVMAHQTFEGAIAETGRQLSGINTIALEAAKPRLCWAGDAHKPQRVGSIVEHIGAPYHVRFGDDYSPRVLLVNDKGQHDLHFPSPRKWSLTASSTNDLAKVKSGDQLKLIVRVDRENVTAWPDLRKTYQALCKERSIELHGLEVEIAGAEPMRERIKNVENIAPADVLSAYCKTEGVSAQIQEVGLELVQSP